MAFVKAEATRAKDEYEVHGFRDVDGNRWLWKSRTTCYDLLDAISFYVMTGWPTSKMGDFLDEIQPSAGWAEEGTPWSQLPSGMHTNDRFSLSAFRMRHING